MTSAPQLPSKDDLYHPLNLIPISELKADLSNFRQWDHAVTFHLRYHNLLHVVYGGGAFDTREEPTTEEERQTQEMKSLHAYSLIASKIEKICPEFAERWGRPLFGNGSGCFHFNPRILWADIYMFCIDL